MMSGIQTIAGHQQDRILSDSIKPGRHMTLTLHTDDGWQTYKGKFEADVSLSGMIQATLMIPGVTHDHPVARPGLPVGCTFRLGHKKCMFSTMVQTAEIRSNGICLSLRRPNELQQLQRRAYDRTPPPNGSVIAVRFWRNSTGQSTTEGRDIHYGQLEDISAGGMRIKVSDATRIEISAIYRCTFAPRADKPTFVIDALLRHKEAAGHGRISLGFQFVGLEATPEGRRQLDRLARLANRFKRAHSRTRKPRPFHS